MNANGRPDYIRPALRYWQFLSRDKRRHIIQVPNTVRDIGRHCLISLNSKAMNESREHDYNQNHESTDLYPPRTGPATSNAEAADKPQRHLIEHPMEAI